MNYQIDVLITNNRVTDAAQTFIENITRYLSAPLQFSSRSMGGYSQASLELAVTDVKAWQFLTDYLGCRIVFVNPHAANPDMIVWEGMIYTVAIDDGKMAVSRTMANIYNAIVVSWVGPSQWTDMKEDAASQALYGHRELHFSSASGLIPDAENIRNMLLKEHAIPATVPTAVTIGGDSRPSGVKLTVECVGVWETLDKLFYTDYTMVQTSTDVTIQKVLNGQSPRFTSADYSHMASNPYQTSSRDAELYRTPTVQKRIETLCAVGSANLLRWFCQFRELGNAYYFEQPTVPAYRARRNDPSEAIYDAATGLVVPPWLVMPGAMMQVDDLVPDEVMYPSSLANPRTFVIDEVRYTAPNRLEITPVVEEPSQMKLSRLGVGLPI